MSWREGLSDSQAQKTSDFRRGMRRGIDHPAQEGLKPGLVGGIWAISGQDPREVEGRG